MGRREVGISSLKAVPWTCSAYREGETVGKIQDREGHRRWLSSLTLALTSGHGGSRIERSFVPGLFPCFVHSSTSL